MKVADVKLFWQKSVSGDVEKAQVTVTNNGTVTVADLGPEVEDFVIEVQAGGSVSFKVVTFDKEGLQSTSETYSFTLGDLEPPQPATLLGHEVVGVRDVADPIPPVSL